MIAKSKKSLFIALVAVVTIVASQGLYARGGMMGGGWSSSGSTTDTSDSTADTSTTTSTDPYVSRRGGNGPLTEQVCRNCHENLELFPMLRVNNPSRHHALIGMTIEHTTSPNGTIGQPYECQSCHVFGWSAETQTYEFTAFRDCLHCHSLDTVSGKHGNRHHATATARSRQCHVCHGTGGMGGMGGM